MSKTGLVNDAYFSGSKLRWILDNIPGARADAENGKLAFGTFESWLIWKLSGGKTHLTDPSNAFRTMLYNIHTGAWNEELLDLFKTPRAVLRRLVKSSG
jgi:glycerol kinase